MTMTMATTSVISVRRESTAISRATEMVTSKARTKDAKTTATIFKTQVGDRPLADTSNGWAPWRCTRMPIAMGTRMASGRVIRAWAGVGDGDEDRDRDIENRGGDLSGQPAYG